VLKDIRSLLYNSNFFSGISKSSIDALAGICIPKSYQKKEVLFHEGQKGHSVYLLATGSIQLFKNSVEGKEVVIKIIAPGEMFGEVILFERNTFPVNAYAMKKSLVFLLPKHQLFCLFERNTFRDDFIRMLMKKQRYLTDKILYLSAYDVQERLFRFLIEQYGKREEYTVSISKKDVARAIGVMPETMSRVLLRLKKQKILQWNENKIRLKSDFWENNRDLYELQ
jgi:CRP/FNR family transcriptional regulator